MKILKIFGVVAGIHAIALIMIFANPGCNSTSSPPPAPKDTAPKADPDPAPSISVPGAAAPAGDSGAIVPAPVTSGADTEITVPGLFSPTRPGTLAASALETQPVADVTPATTYVVGKGDSLWIIAKKNKMKVSVLAKANGISSGSPLHLGQRLIIPGAAPAGGAGPAAPDTASSPPMKTAAAASGPAAPATAGATRHVVRPGETLGAIARKFGVRVGDLALANNISDPQKIRPGQELVIPARRVKGASPNPPSPAAAGYGAASPDSSPAAPAASGQDQDLDAGLKPAAAGGVPTIKIDDTASPPGDSKQP